MTTSVICSQAGKKPCPPSREQPRNESAKGVTATSRTALRPRRRLSSPVIGLPECNVLLDPPMPGGSITSFSFGRHGHIVNSSPTRSLSVPNGHISSSSPLSRSELDSVASMTNYGGRRSSLHSGDLATASVLESFKRLLERHWYKISRFISPGEDMWEVSFGGHSRGCIDLTY